MARVTQGTQMRGVAKGAGQMSRAHPIRVMIVDDHRIIRTGLRFSLLAFDDLKLVADTESGEEALRLCREMLGSASMPDVVLMDIVMPGMDGVATTQAILDEFPDVRVLALTGFGTDALVDAALRAGATGYILKDGTIDELAEAIRAAHAGRITLAPAAARSLARASGRASAARIRLTQPEHEDSALLVGGPRHGPNRWARCPSHRSHEK
jgi:NarL family two-component system response regulator LiaR